jgi:hypothetical protein
MCRGCCGWVGTAQPDAGMFCPPEIGGAEVAEGAEPNTQRREAGGQRTQRLPLKYSAVPRPAAPSAL